MLVLALVWPAAGPVRAQDAGWLYVVDVPVADQSQGARQQGARAALAVVLTRLTGLADVSTDPRARSAFASPDRYYNRFGYAAGAAPDETLLRVQFSPPALFGLIRSAGLPIWPSNRPLVRAWLVVDDGAELRLADATADQALLAAFSKRALERGLQVRIGAADGSAPPAAAPGRAGTIPSAGAVDAAATGAEAQTQPGQTPGAAADVDPTAVTRAPDDVMLRPALQPANPVWPTLGLWDAAAADVAAMVEGDPGELPLVARIGATPGGTWMGRWEVVEAPPPAPALPAETAPGTAATSASGAAPEPGEATQAPAGAGELQPPAPVEFDARGATAEALAAAVVDGLVDHLLGRYQVQAGTSRVVTVAVDALGSARDYAQVLELFGSVEVIDDIAVVGAEGERMRFALTTMAALEQVTTLVTADGRLVQVPADPLSDLGPASPSGGPFIEAPSPDPAGSPSGSLEPAAAQAGPALQAAAAPGSGGPGNGVGSAPGVDLVLRWQGS